MKKKPIIIIVFALCLSILVGCGSKHKPTLTIQIDSTQVSYIEAYCFALSPRTVRMEDDPELISALIEMFNGTYSYYDTWERNPISSVSGPYSVIFYDNSRNEIMKLSFMDDSLYVVNAEGESNYRSYYRYRHTEYPLDFASFYKTVYGYTG